MNKKHRIVTVLIAIAIAFTTVTTIAVVDDDVTITAEAASKVSLSTTKKTIGYKQSFNLSIKNTGSKTVKWSTSNKKIAKITKVSKTKYKVTGVKPGTATIKAKVGGKTYKCKVTVSKISRKTKTITKGDTFNLSLKGITGTVKWSSSDKSVASIKKISNKKYKVTGKKTGTATITAKVNGKKYKCKVTVQSVSDKAIQLVKGKWYKNSSEYKNYYYKFTKKNFVTYNASTNKVVRKDPITSITHKNGKYRFYVNDDIKYIFEETNNKEKEVLYYFYENGEWHYSGGSSMVNTNLWK